MAAKNLALARARSAGISPAQPAPDKGATRSTANDMRYHIHLSMTMHSFECAREQVRRKPVPATSESSSSCLEAMCLRMATLG